MKKSWIVAVVGAASLVATALAVSAPTATASDTAKLHPARVCKEVAAKDEATCHAVKMVDSEGALPAADGPPPGGLTPEQVRAAYGLTNASSGGKTVGIVDAYGYPNLERDLGIYRAEFGLPECTTENGCLRIVNQAGRPNLPRLNISWAQEQALDVDAVSATCPDCKILVVQAKNASILNLGTAVNTAVRLGADVVSNSYGVGDVSDASYGSDYDHPGVAITASTGDAGYQGATFPASSAYVTAVGGTSLSMSGTTRVSETAWQGAGSGCSTVNAALPAAATFDTGCGSKRAIADVSAAADPAAGGLAVYAPISKTSSIWGRIGGTSESAPIIASVYAMAGTISGYANDNPYANPGALYDIDSGSNGTCTPAQLCTARTGWDGPTGLGTPNGTGAF